jgi:dATP pyrophosphohydrolase
MSKKKLIDLYPYRFLEKNGPEFLLCKRASNKIYSGQWRMIGGKVEPDETYWQAALRELREETALVPEKFWTVPSLNQFYEAKHDQILSIPVFAAEINASAQPVLNDEHTTFGWFGLNEAADRIIWPEQQRLIAIIDKIVTSTEIPEEWIVAAT